MVFLKNNLFIRLFLPLVLGIIVQFTLAFSPLPIIVSSIITLLLIVLFTFKKSSYSLRFMHGISLNVFLFFIGMALVDINQSQNKINLSNSKLLFAGEVQEPPLQKERYYKTKIYLTAIKQNQSWHEYNATIMAYFEASSEIDSLKAGQQIVFNSNLSEVTERQNPFGFDYSKYLAVKNINQTAYIKANEWQLLSKTESGLKNKALNLRKKLIETFYEHGIQDDNLAVLSALTLGYKDKLDEKVRKAYSGAGAMHVLAVSGLHVGIIYKILEWLLIWMGLFKKAKKFKALIIILALYCYAFITGLSPSVMRATVMFTFIIGAQVLNKRSSIYNSLAASAFLLLLINPLLIFEIGFQLSYIAVIGIVFFQPKIKNLLYFKFCLFNKIWEYTAVSIAAQIATFPITIYYFHQFPSYFWLSNIVVTFAAAGLIILAFLLIVSSSFTAISSVLSIIINYILKINYAFIDVINRLPGSLIENISLHSFQVVLCYAIITGLSIWLLTKRYLGIFTSLACIFVFGMIQLNTMQSANEQSAICVYHVNSETAIQFINRNTSVWLCSNTAATGKSHTIMNDANLYWHTDYSEPIDLLTLNDTILKHPYWYYNSGYWSTSKSKGLVINSNSYLPRTPADTLHLDYIFVSGNPTFTLKEISDKITYNKVIIDGSVPYWKVNNFSSSGNKPPAHYTKKDGAFIHQETL